MNAKELIMLQNLPLEIKVAKSLRRIEEWVTYWGKENVYISFSGGKDSTVLLHLVRQLYPTIEAVYVDTGLEYPEVKAFVKKQSNVRILKPKLTFKQVIEKYGYPIISKEQARYIEDIRNSTPTMKYRRLCGDSKGRYKLSKKWRFLLKAPFKISSKCCDIMKKKPIKEMEKKEQKVGFVGTMAGESSLRNQSYLQHGCNAFESSRPISMPIGFWNESDVLEYIYQNNLEIPSVYGDIILVNGNYTTSKLKRTGCVWCAFGVHLEGTPNRFQLLEKSHPQLHDYCINKLNFKDVLEFLDLPYKN